MRKFLILVSGKGHSGGGHSGGGSGGGYGGSSSGKAEKKNYYVII